MIELTSNDDLNNIINSQIETQTKFAALKVKELIVQLEQTLSTYEQFVNYFKSHKILVKSYEQFSLEEIRLEYGSQAICGYLNFDPFCFKYEIIQNKTHIKYLKLKTQFDQRWFNSPIAASESIIKIIKENK